MSGGKPQRRVRPRPTPYTILYGRDGYRAACVQHNWLSPVLRATYEVAAADALKHEQESHP